jgi:hypothetical protein
MYICKTCSQKVGEPNQSGRCWCDNCQDYQIPLFQEPMFGNISPVLVDERSFNPPTHENFFSGPYVEIHDERIRAHQKHDTNCGSMERKPWSSEWWLSVVGEEYGEVCRELCEQRLGNRPTPKVDLRKELIQVAAMVVAWIDAIDHDLC